MAQLGPAAYAWLTAIFDLIEATGRWPVALSRAKGVFIVKDPDKPEPALLDNRILLILANAYREWS
eukprot:1319960-Lingulodinium_polyedra.AAC.1